MAADGADHFDELFGAKGGVLFAAGHRVDAGGIVDGAVDVVDAEGQGELGGGAADHGPVGFDVVEVVQEDAADGVLAEVFDHGGLRQVTQFVVLVAELQGNEGLEAAGLVLQLPQFVQVVDPMAVLLDVAVEHGCVGAHTEPVPDFVDA